jgi:hypothetical protein
VEAKAGWLALLDKADVEIINQELDRIERTTTKHTSVVSEDGKIDTTAGTIELLSYIIEDKYSSQTKDVLARYLSSDAVKRIYADPKKADQFRTILDLVEGVRETEKALKETE